MKPIQLLCMRKHELASTSIRDKVSVKTRMMGVEYCICPNILYSDLFHHLLDDKSRRDYTVNNMSIFQTKVNIVMLQVCHSSNANPTFHQVLWTINVDFDVFHRWKKVCERGESSSAGVSSATTGESGSGGKKPKWFTAGLKH